MRKEFGTDSRAVVLDNDLCLRAGASQDDPHASAVGRELERVREQVPDDLLQTGGVSGHRSNRRVQLPIDGDAFRIRCRFDGLDGCVDDRCQVNALNVEAELARHDPADVEQVRNELRLKSSIAGDDLQTAGRQPDVVALLQHQVRPTENRIQRRAQFVRDHRHEVILQTIGPLRFSPSGALGEKQPLSFAHRRLTLEPRPVDAR